MDPSVSTFFSNTWQWIALALFSGSMLGFETLKNKQSSKFSATPAQATLLINREDAVVLDIREDAEFDAGHINGARHIPLAHLNTRIEELSRFKDTPVIAYCNTGQRAYAAAKTLEQAGFSKVRLLSGGLKAWEGAGQPITKKRK